MDFDDLDDLIEDLIPKKSLKKLKKKAKKISLWGAILAMFRSFTGFRLDKRESRPSSSTRSAKSQPRPERQTTPAPQSDAITQAQQYRNRIEAMALAAAPDSVERARLDALSERVSEWTLAIESLVKRSAFDSEDQLLAQQKEEVPKAIRRLEKQLDSAEDPQLRTKLARTLAARKSQLEQINRSKNQQQITELKIEHALAQLGIIYTQLLNGQQLSERSSYERLSAEINEETLVLEDYLYALDDLTNTHNSA